MSKKIKPQQVKAKIAVLETKNKGGECEHFPTFSFRYMTKNKRYNFNFFPMSQSSDKIKTQSNVYSRLEEISKESWLKLSQYNKYLGFETRDYSYIRFLAGVDLPKDESIYIIRFDLYNGDKGRILGFKKRGCPILYIIGYDFDFSAYSHGR